MDSLSEGFDGRIQHELWEGERLVWSGQPLPHRFARSSWALVLFGIPWTTFSVFWVVLAAVGVFMGGGGKANGIFVCFPLFGLPFVLIGVWMLSAPYWMRRQARRVCYGLTDKRVIVWQAGWFGGVEVRTYTAANLGQMVRRENADGTGDLIFEERFSQVQVNHGQSRSGRMERGFIGIENVREVEQLIRRTLELEI